MDLDNINDQVLRMELFIPYMKSHFNLGNPHHAGFYTDTHIDRSRADYARMLRGWFFNPDSQEAAVLKGWIESRFGLTPRYHHGVIRGLDEVNYIRYLQEKSAGIYNTNSLEAQSDLLYSYYQYEIVLQHNNVKHITLYRGTNHFSKHEILQQTENNTATILLNNINSFCLCRETAEQFGDCVLRVEVPLVKVFYYSGLLPGIMPGEQEYAVVGGIYHAEVESS